MSGGVELQRLRELDSSDDRNLLTVGSEAVVVPTVVRGEESVPLTSDGYAVLVRDATKSYRQFLVRKAQPILRKLNLHVPYASVYALLGPSGCGKTTLLRCIIGRLGLDSGSVTVFGYPPGTAESGVPGKRVGYMPQDIALYNELTINENLSYYGKAFGMSDDDIKSRIQFLLEFLELPAKETTFSTLSGGQQRRVSFATSLLHDPELLIVDEPTVGVDSLLRKRIWNYLHNQASTRNKTIIITTHYIEEARMAHTVGMMHDGSILTETPPEQMIRQYNCTTLEGVFLKLCIAYEDRKQTEGASGPDDATDDVTSKRNDASDAEAGDAVNGSLVNGDVDDRKRSITYEELKPGALKINGDSHAVDNHYVQVASPPIPFASKLVNFLQPPKLYRLQATTMKNLRKTYRDYKIIIVLVLAPLLVTLIYGLAYRGNPRDLPIGIVNVDEMGMGQSFLNCIDRGIIIQKIYETVEEGQQAVTRGDTWGLINIPQNFSSSLIERFLHGVHVDDETIAMGTIDVSLDLTNQPISITVYGELHKAFLKFGKGVLERTGLDPALVDMPIVINENIYGDEEQTFMDFAAPGIILSCIYFISICLTILSFFLERLSGQIERSAVTGITAMEMALSFVFSCFTIMSIQTATLLIMCLLVLDVLCRGSIILVALLTLLQGLCGLTFGLIISALCDSEYTAVMLAFGGYLPNLCVNGVFWPIQGMPAFLRTITVYLPQTLAVAALRDIMSRGWGITHFSVFMGYFATIVWILIFFIGAAITLRLKG